MRAASEITVPASFHGEPGDPSPDAIGGWSAVEAREYADWKLAEEIRQHAELYGWAATEATILAALPPEGADHE